MRLSLRHSLLGDDNLILIGMPGAGKSTVGVLAAKALARGFIDTDLLIQAEAGRPLQAIIDARGMEAFLDLEARVIRELHVREQVIATGGSVVYRAETMTHLRTGGVTVYLSVPLPELERRIRNMATRGIAMQPGQTLHNLYEEREPLYRRYADLIIDAGGMDLEDTVARLVDQQAS